MHYVKIGSKIRIFKEDDLAFSKDLGTNTYILKFVEQTGEYFLEIGDAYHITHKIYGDVQKRVTRIMNSFNEKKGNMGVLLVGTKGSGKTLLSKYLSEKAAEAGMPTIIINSKHSGEEFLSFINSINTPCVIVFDEFDKVYNKHGNEQRDLLTILDGVYVSRHLYVFTANDAFDIDSLLINRPGRVYYKFNYTGLEEQFVREYCIDNLKNKDEVESVVTISNAFNDFNFDMLQALVEEMNRYDETAEEVVQWLNISPSGEQSTYDVTVFGKDGNQITKGIWPVSFENIDVMNQKQKRYINVDTGNSEDIDEEYGDSGTVTLWLKNQDISDFAPDLTMFTYDVDGYKVILRKRMNLTRIFGPWV
jgi:hypothetical protein